MLLDVVFDYVGVIFFFFKQKTAYEMRISDWSSDVCSSDLRRFDVRISKYKIEELPQCPTIARFRSEEHTSELQSLMRISYAVFCLKKKKQRALIILNQSNNDETRTQDTQSEQSSLIQP